MTPMMPTYPSEAVGVRNILSIGRSAKERAGTGWRKDGEEMALRVTVQIASDEGDMWEAQSRPPARDEERRSKATPDHC